MFRRLVWNLTFDLCIGVVHLRIKTGMNQLILLDLNQLWELSVYNFVLVLHSAVHLVRSLYVGYKIL